MTLPRRVGATRRLGVLGVAVSKLIRRFEDRQAAD